MSVTADPLRPYDESAAPMAIRSKMQHDQALEDTGAAVHLGGYRILPIVLNGPAADRTPHCPDRPLVASAPDRSSDLRTKDKKPPAQQEATFDGIDRAHRHKDDAQTNDNEIGSDKSRRIRLEDDRPAVWTR